MAQSAGNGILVVEILEFWPPCNEYFLGKKACQNFLRPYASVDYSYFSIFLCNSRGTTPHHYLSHQTLSNLAVFYHITQLISHHALPYHILTDTISCTIYITLPVFPDRHEQFLSAISTFTILTISLPKPSLG